MLSRVELNSFKQHKNLVVDFSTGLTLITGPNYSGKSNLVKAIAFALGGVSMIPGTAETLPTRGERKGACRVKLDLSVDDATWRIDRGLSSVKLYKNGEVVATGNTAVGEKVDELLGVDRKTFNLIKYVKQGDTQALLTLGSSKLHNLLENLTGAHLVNKAITKLSDRVKHLAGVLEGFGSEPEGYEQTVAWKQDYDGKLVAWHSQLEVLKEQSNAATQVLEMAKAEHAQLSQYNLRNSSLAGQWASFFSSRDELTDQIAAANNALSNDVVEDPAPLATAIAEIDHLYQLTERARDQLSLANESITRVTSDLGSSNRDREELQATLTSIEVTDDELAAAETRLQAATLELGKAKGLVDAISESISGAVCPTCRRPFEDHDPEKLAGELVSAQTALGGAQIVHTEAGLAASSARAREAHRNQCASRLSAISEHQDTLKARQISLQVSAEALNNTVNELSDRLGEDFMQRRQSLQERHRRATEGLGRIRQAEAQLQALQTRLNALKQPEQSQPLKTEEEAAALANVRTLASDLQGLNTLVGDWQTHYAVEYAKWQRWKEVVEAEERRKAAVTEKVKEKRLASSLLKFIRTNRDRFMTELWAGVTGMASEFASVCTNGAIQGIKRTDDSNFLFTEDGQDIPVIEASGAQKSIMSIGLLVALNRLVPGSFETLVLDEPGADMDDAHSAALTQALASSGSQLVVISHRDLDGSLAGAHTHLEGVH